MLRQQRQRSMVAHWERSYWGDFVLANEAVASTGGRVVEVKGRERSKRQQIETVPTPQHSGRSPDGSLNASATVVRTLQTITDTSIHHISPKPPRCVFLAVTSKGSRTD